MMKNILNYLEKTKDKYKNKIAFSCEDARYTFKDTYEITRSVATYILKKGHYKEPVIVAMKRSSQMVLAMLGVIQSGCYYVPVSEDINEYDFDKIIEKTGSSLIIADALTLGRLKERKGLEVYNFSEMILTKADENLIEEVGRKHDSGDNAYIVFTSGSTGEPKGIVGTHENIITYIEGFTEALDIDENTVFGNQGPLFLDACFKEIYSTLKTGATTHIIPKKILSFPTKLIEYMNEKNINTICVVVSLLKLIMAYDTFEYIKPKSLKKVAFVGEVFEVSAFKKLQQSLPEVDYYNLYGPTETTGVCCYKKIEDNFKSDTIPIGKPLKGYEVFIYDEGKDEISEEQGEIIVSGKSLTKGYLSKEESEKSFVRFKKLGYERAYRTGDIGKYDESGDLIFIARKDDQIKHLGYKIELGEIESKAMMMDGVSLCAAIYKKPQQAIAMYYKGEISEKDLRSNLSLILEKYKIPSIIKKVEEIPFTKSGKIDKKRLAHGRID